MKNAEAIFSALCLATRQAGIVASTMRRVPDSTVKSLESAGYTVIDDLVDALMAPGAILKIIDVQLARSCAPTTTSAMQCLARSLEMRKVLIWLISRAICSNGRKEEDLRRQCLKCGVPAGAKSINESGLVFSWYYFLYGDARAATTFH